MDKPHNNSGNSPGYETRDANTGGVYNFLVAMAVTLVITGLVCWGMFRYFSAHYVDQPASDSPFADTRQLPLGPQLQVNPREDWKKFREEQDKTLETYAWENRSAGTARVPIEVAMDLLVKKGVPVQGMTQAQPAEATMEQAGAKVFQASGCSTCHTPDGAGLGPSLLGVYGNPVKLTTGETVMADDAYMRESILLPKAKVVQGYTPIMPTFQGQLTDEQINNVIAYLHALGKSQPKPKETPEGSKK
jgi:mono/diheme cytochrome c family protein